MKKFDLKINIFITPSYRSEPKAWLKDEGNFKDIDELLERSVNEYNHSTHTTKALKC